MADSRSSDFYPPKIVGGNDYVGNQQPELKGGDGGGTFDGMGPRIAKLETDMEYMKRDLGLLQADVRTIQSDIGGKDGVRDRLTKIEERMATKGFTIVVVMAALALISALVVFQGNIQRFVGASPALPASQTPTPAQAQPPKVP